MIKTISLLGLQWGDEGKGKVVDNLSKDLDAAVRYQGGHNAGHTLFVDGKKIVFHLLPSAICHKNIKCFLGRGVVISLEALFKEIEDAKELIGEVEGRFFISTACSLIQPYHIKLDQLREKSNKSTKIGTTGRGIGTAYEDRVGRRAIRVTDLYQSKKLESKIEEALDYYNFIFKHSYNSDTFDKHKLIEENNIFADKLKPYKGNIISELCFASFR